MMKRHKMPGSCSGFTLVEVMLVVSVVGLLAVLAIPAVMKARRQARDGAFVSDLRTCSAVFEQYAVEKGDFPPDAAPGTVPSGIGNDLPKRFDFSAKTPIGGRWDWDRAPNRTTKFRNCYAGLSVSKPQRTSAQMREIDRRIDDGNLYTGTFQGWSNGYIHILEP
jgi:prepilin-type N-terminal cleavage/methylation domain-containing protein